MGYNYQGIFEANWGKKYTANLEFYAFNTGAWGKRLNCWDIGVGFFGSFVI
jgi:hypothetical protein